MDRDQKVICILLCAALRQGKDKMYSNTNRTTGKRTLIFPQEFPRA